MKKMSRSQFWVFTLNNYTEEEVGHLLSLNSDKWCVVFGKETAPTTGTPHLQGCLWRFDEVRVMRSAVEKALGGRAWVDVTYDIQSAIGYSVKEGDFYTNFLNADELLEVRAKIEEAKRYGKENIWLGAVFQDPGEIYEAWYDTVMWNWRCGQEKKKKKF